MMMLSAVTELQTEYTPGNMLQLHVSMTEILTETAQLMSHCFSKALQSHVAANTQVCLDFIWKVKVVWSEFN